jgi:hypothetical protein
MLKPHPVEKLMSLVPELQADPQDGGGLIFEVHSCVVAHDGQNAAYGTEYCLPMVDMRVLYQKLSATVQRSR